MSIKQLHTCIYMYIYIVPRVVSVEMSAAGPSFVVDGRVRSEAALSVCVRGMGRARDGFHIYLRGTS